MTNNKEGNEMAAPATHPIRPTSIHMNSQKEFNEFIDWAEGRTKNDSEGLKKAREIVKNHRPSSPRK